ncbi:MAG: prepilin-type N-terminal cleavage/methylation domain-containing protein [Leptolyngbya sp. SIO1E4]|nr:prepilin-type N-terminal cleavage/methylation domain-containing protein [Leptolyngbya sp. SIO1E4]
MNIQKNAHAGFTLIEVLVVLVIMTVLAAIAFPAYSGMVRRARYAEAKQQMGMMAREVKLYHLEQGQYPPDVNPNVQPQGITSWPKDVPYESTYDYDHWAVGESQCYVQIGYAGESGTRAYPVHRLNQKPPGFKEIGDNLVLGIALYSCQTNSRGSIR